MGGREGAQGELGYHMGSEKERSRPRGQCEREVRPCPMLSAEEESGRCPEVTNTPPRPVERVGMGGHFGHIYSSSGLKSWTLADVGYVPLDKFLTLSDSGFSICYLKQGCDG